MNTSFVKKLASCWVAIIVAAIFSALAITSCATPNRTHVSVRNDAENSSVDISIKNGDGGTSTITVSPRLAVEIPLQSPAPAILDSLTLVR